MLKFRIDIQIQKNKFSKQLVFVAYITTRYQDDDKMEHPSVPHDSESYGKMKN